MEIPFYISFLSVLGQRADVVKHPDNLQPEGQFTTRQPEHWSPGERAEVVRRVDNLKPEGKFHERPQEKSSNEALTYACVKLEALAGIDSLKKDAQIRQSIQMEMLTNKFNKVSNNLNSVDDLLIHFINNISAKPTAAEKTLWKRVSKTIDILV